MNALSSVKQITEADDTTKQKEKPIAHFDKVTKLLLLAVSSQSVHTLSYNCHSSDDQLTTTHNLSHWLELRLDAFESSVYNMIGLRNPYKYDEINGSRITKHLLKVKSNPDILLDYQSYVTYVEENEINLKSLMDKSGQSSSQSNKSHVHNQNKLHDNESDGKKKKHLVFNKDFQDLYIEKLVKNFKEQRRTGEIDTWFNNKIFSCYI